MGSEAVPSPPGGQEASSTPDTPDGQEKTKRRPRKPVDPRASTTSLPTTEAGEKVADQVQRKLIEMVNAAAPTEANRRRATAIDATDYEAGFDLIAGPSKRENTVAIVADVAGAMGTGLIGYAINVYTGSSPEKSNGHLAMIGGGTLLITGIVLKYVTHGR